MSETMSSDRTCPKCGAPMAANTTEGLCPACLLALNLATQTQLPEDLGPNGTKKMPPPLKSPPAPQDIAGQFPQLEIIECLGRGGMGVVYKARQKSLDRLVALKILAPEREKDPQFAERFAREAKTLAQLSHPSIVTVHDFGEANGMFYLVMEFVDGVNLRQLLRERKLSPEEALAIVPPVCEALQYAHRQGVIHRDIKPENLLLDKQGRIKIADFGIAKILGRTTHDASTAGGGDRRPGEGAGVTQDQVIGTPQYMAPEQTASPQKVDHRADIYSLGVVLYEMLTGEPPGKRFEPPSKKVRVDVRIDEIVLRALEKEPERRYQTATQFKTMVETMATAEPKSEDRSHNLEEDQRTSAGAGPRYNPWEPLIVFMGTIFFVVMLPVGLESSRPFALPLILLSIVGLAICVISWAGVWPFPSPLFPEPNFSSRNLRPHKEPASPLSETGVRVSRAAIAGASWAGIALLAAVGAILANYAGIQLVFHGPLWWEMVDVIFVVPLTLIAVTSPFGTTIFGWVSVTQIRRSAGRLYGLRLAVFDGLLFPLLKLDGLIIGAASPMRVAVSRLFTGGNGSIEGMVGAYGVFLWAPFWLGAAFLLSIALDYLIVRGVWRAVNRSGTDTPQVGTRPKFSVGIMLAIVVVALATALCLLMVIWNALARRLPMPHTGVPLLLPFFGGVLIFLLVMSVVVVGLVFVLNRKKPGVAGRVVAIGCVVLLAGGVFILALGAGTFFWLRNSEMEASRRHGQAVAQAIEARRMSDAEARAAVANELAFGPAIDCALLGVNEHRTDCFVDLDTGRLFDPPSSLNLKNRQAVFDWCRMNGMDAVANTDSKIRGLLGYDLIACSVRDEDWSHPDLARIRQELANTAWAGQRFDADPLSYAALTVNTVSTDPKGTYAFQTREGGFGLLQFVSYTDAPRGSLKIRYKLLQQPGSRPPSLESTSTNVTNATALSLKPIPPEAVALLAKLKALPESPAYAGKLDDTNVLNAFSSEFSSRTADLKGLLRGTAAWPLVEHQDEQIKSLQKALEDHDETEVRRATEQIKQLGDRVETTIESSDSSGR